MTGFIQSLLDNAHADTRLLIEEGLPSVAGSRIVATLTEDEIATYVIVSNMELELQAAQEFLVKRHLGHSVNVIMESEELSQLSLHDIASAASERKFFENETEANDFFRRLSRWEARQAVFWNELRERIGVFSEYLELRHGWRVVSAGSKYL